METRLQTPCSNDIIMLDIIRGPKKQRLLRALGPCQAAESDKKRIIALLVDTGSKVIILRLCVEAYRYDPFDTNAIIATGRLVKTDERAKTFCSQVQFRYDCTCDSGKIRLTQSAA